MKNPFEDTKYEKILEEYKGCDCQNSNSFICFSLQTKEDGYCKCPCHVLNSPELNIKG